MSRTATPVSRAAPQGRSLGRYLIFDEIASGGTATVHIGRRRGPTGGQLVAIKRLHTHLAGDPQYASMFLAEARLTGRVRHPNVVPLVEVLDAGGGELLLVMDYVHGETLGAVLGVARRRGRAIPPSVAVAIISDMLLGLHAAHEAVSEDGAPLSLVHGDVSPHNIIVGADGKARLLDFGIARAVTAAAAVSAGTAPSSSPSGEAPGARRVMGTPAYMAPERWRPDSTLDRRSDVFSAGVVFWEMLALDRLFRGQGDPQSAVRAARPIPPPSRLNPAVTPALDAVVLKALAAKPEDRWATALEFLRAVGEACKPAGSGEVSSWINVLCGQRLRERAADLARIEAVGSAEFVATEVADEDPTIVESDLAARLARLVERDSPPPPARARRLVFPPSPIEELRTDRKTPSRTLPLILRSQTPPTLAAVTEPGQPPARPAPVKPAARFTPPMPMHTVGPSSERRPTAADLDLDGEPAAQQPQPASPRPSGRRLTSRTAARRHGSDDDDESLVPAGRRPPGRFLVVMASVPSVILVLVLFGRSQPATTRAEAASPPPTISQQAPPAPMPPATLPPPIAVERALPPPAPVVTSTPAPVASPVTTATTPVPVPSAGVAPPAVAAASPTAAAAAVPAPTLAPAAVAAVAPEAPAEAPPSPEPPVASAPPADRLAHQGDRLQGRRLAVRRAPAGDPDALAEMHRRAIAAYEDLDPDTALSLLRRVLQRCEDGCDRNPQLLARTHLHLGVVLAGGFKQPGLAARHFRMARTLEPRLVPAERFQSTYVKAALRLSATP